MKKIKVIVTGGAGFIGSNLSKSLVKAGYDVHVIDNLIAGNRSAVAKGAKLHVLDIKNLKKIKPVFKGAQAVFHLAALPRVQFTIEHPIESNEVNVGGTLNVLIAAKEAGVDRVVFSTSAAVYGDQPTMPLVEAMPTLPKSPYGLQKYIGERYCQMFSEIYGLETVCLRYFNVYGPGQSDEGAYALVIAKFLKQKREGKPMTITGTGKQTRDFTHVSDVVNANILAMKSKKVGKGEVINIGAGKNQSVNLIAKLLGGPFEYIPARLEPTHALAANSLAKKLLGWTPKVSIEEGLEELRNS